MDKFPSPIMPQVSICVISSPFVPTNHSQSFLFLSAVIPRIQCDDKCEIIKLALWFHAGRARTPGQTNHTELISLLLIQGVSEFDWGAAGPAAAQSSQCSSCQANHASSRSFRGMSIPNKKSSISALSSSSRC